MKVLASQSPLRPSTFITHKGMTNISLPAFWRESWTPNDEVNVLSTSKFDTRCSKFKDAFNYENLADAVIGEPGAAALSPGSWQYWSCYEQYAKSGLLLCPVRRCAEPAEVDKMSVSPDKERSPGVWQRTHKLLAWFYAAEQCKNSCQKRFLWAHPFTDILSLTGQVKSGGLVGFLGAPGCSIHTVWLWYWGIVLR